MADLLVIVPSILLLVFLFWNRRKHRQWQAHYDAVEQTAIRIAQARNQRLPVR